jgi:putative heme-binding domain-containing protein
MLRRNIVRRLACDPEKQNKMLEKLTQRAMLSANSHDAVDILHGIKAAVEGRKKMKAPPSWPFKLGKVDSETTKLIEEISPVFGDGLSMDRLMKLAAKKEADSVARQQAIESLSQFADADKLFPILKANVNDRLVSTSVVKAFAVCDSDEVPSLILNEYRRLSTEGKRNAIETLCSRKKWANKLLGAVEKERVQPSELTAWHARQIQLFDDESLTDRLAKVWGKVRETSQQRLAQIDALREMMTKDVSSADVASGKKLFATHCASCHVMFGDGGNIGPDLTGADRKNLNYLLENIVDPSASVATSYRASVLAMEDGRLLTGVVMDNNGQTLKLQTQEELVTLEVDSVEEIKQTELSLMPEGLLDKLSDKEKVDLFGYLMSK